MAQKSLARTFLLCSTRTLSRWSDREYRKLTDLFFYVRIGALWTW